MPCLSTYMRIASTWATAHHEYFVLSSNFKDFLELSCWCVKRSRRCVTYMCYRHQTKYSLSQSVSQDQVMLYTRDCWPFRLHRLSRVIKISNSAGDMKVCAPATDHLSIKKRQHIKLLRRDNHMDHLSQTFSLFFYSLMMAMIIILRCGDVESNPGPQTSKLTLKSIALCGYQQLVILSLKFVPPKMTMQANAIYKVYGANLWQAYETNENNVARKYQWLVQGVLRVL